MNRAPPTWRTGTRAPRGRWEWPGNLRTRRDQHGDRHRDRHDGFSPIVCITGQVGSGVIVPTPSRRPTLPASRFRSPNTIIWSRVPKRLLPACVRRFTSQPPTGPGRCLWILRRTRKGIRVNSIGGCRTQGSPASSRFFPAPAQMSEAIALINESRRPVILAGHGIILSGQCAKCRCWLKQREFPWR